LHLEISFSVNKTSPFFKNHAINHILIPTSMRRGLNAQAVLPYVAWVTRPGHKRQPLYFVPTFSQVDKGAGITTPPLPWLDLPYKALFISK
jgi:hypothetical protein